MGYRLVEINSKNIEENYHSVQERIVKASIRSHRSPDDIKLVVVTKSQPVQVIQAVIDAGASILGENYAEEALHKIEAFTTSAKVKWHMIGHIQRRKARIVADHFTMVHSLDSLKLAERLNGFCGEIGRQLPVLLEFNLAGEETKSGWLVRSEIELDKLSPEIGQIKALPWLKIAGLMTMPPLCDDPEASRPYFKKLFKYRGILSDRYPDLTWSELSMGTSLDFEIAIQEGATMVRIGQAILGPRRKT